MEKIEEKLKKIKDDFDNYLKDIDSLTHMGDDVGNVIVSLLESLKKDYIDIPGFIPFKEKLDRTIEIIENIKDHPSLKEKYKIIYNQATVLVVANFESFMSNLFRILIDYSPEKINWPEKKKIAVDLSLLKYSSPSVGDLIVKSLKGDINFQDWQSTLRFLKEYLNIDISEKISRDNQDRIILYQAMRHIIIHNSAVIDPDFIKQIRSTKFYNKYKDEEGKKVQFDEKSYKAARELFSKIVNLIVENLPKN